MHTKYVILLCLLILAVIADKDTFESRVTIMTNDEDEANKENSILSLIRFQDGV